MTQRNNPGMRLRQISNPRKKDRLWMIQTLVALMATLVLVMTVSALTGNGWAAMLILALVLGIVYGVMLKTDHESWFYLGVLTVMLLVTLICRRQVLEGFRIFWNQTSDAMVRGTGWVLPEWELKLPKEQQNLCAGFFAGVFSGAICLICCLLTSVAPVCLAVILPGALFAGMRILGMDGDFLYLLPVLMVSVLILIYSGWRKRGTPSPILVSWALCTVAACVMMSLVVMPGIRNWTNQIQEGVHQRIHQKKYETKYTTLPEGDFSDYQKTERKAAQALAVTMEKPQQMYLRGFTGAVFTGDAWEALDTQDLAKNKQLLYWLNLNAFDQNAQFDGAASHARLTQNIVTVQNVGACSYYRYVPFSIVKGTWTQAENLNTDGVYGAGERSYVYSVTAGTSDEIMEVLTWLQTSADPGVLQYRKAESGYRQFVSHYYLQVPEEVKQLLQNQWDEIVHAYGNVNNLTMQQAQECALIFLSRCFPEEGAPEDMKLPLEMAEGTTFQYATVAAMTLRYFGIPARYAEGYVISQEMAAKYNPGETITVDSSCAKAWVEVYQDGIGWIPMDLTLGIGELLEDQDSKNPNKSHASNKDTTSKKDKEEEDPQEKEQPEPVGGSMVLVILKTLFWNLLKLLALWLVIFLILWIRRKILLGRKEKKFQCESLSDGVAWIYGDAALLLEKLGFDRGNGSMRSLTGALEEKFGKEFVGQFKVATDLNDRAMFSSQMMTEDHVQTVRAFRSQVLGKLKTEMKRYRRMWLKWVRCLY